MATRPPRDSASFPPVVTAVVCVAALYFARSVLVPIALAVLFAFLLAPLVNLLQKAHLGRTGPVIVVVLLIAGLLMGLGWLVFNQAISLATQIPNYKTTISRKIEAFRGVRENGIGKAEATVTELAKNYRPRLKHPLRTKRMTKVRKANTHYFPAAASRIRFRSKLYSRTVPLRPSGRC